MHWTAWFPTILISAMEMLYFMGRTRHQDRFPQVQGPAGTGLFKMSSFRIPGNTAVNKSTAFTRNVGCILNQFQPRETDSAWNEQEAFWKKNHGWNACTDRVTFLQFLLLKHLVLSTWLKNAVGSTPSTVNNVNSTLELELFCNCLARGKWVEVSTGRCYTLTKNKRAWRWWHG